MSVIAQRADRAIGYLVEQQYRSKAHAYFQRIARRLHVLTPEELLDAALAGGTLEVWQAEQVRWADAVIRGRRDGEQVLLCWRPRRWWSATTSSAPGTSRRAAGP